MSCAYTVPAADMARIREKTAEHARDSLLHQRPQITELVRTGAARTGECKGST